MSRRIVQIAFAFALLPFFAAAQNNIPVITNTTAVLDGPNNKVDITFDVSDSESDDLDIWIQVSVDSGYTWRVPLDSVSGDVGFPVTPGTGKSISWHFDLTNLANFTGNTGNYDFRIRVIADDRQPIDIGDIVNMVDSARISDNLNYVQGIRHRTANPTHLYEVRDSLMGLVAAQGVKDWHDQWDYQGYNATNVMGRNAGISDEEKTWLISGHYDSVNIAPGADDNGSGVVGVMEALHVLGPMLTEHSVRFIFWDLEENGLNGSVRYVANQIPSWEETAGLLNMETMGYYSDDPYSQQIPSGFNILFPAATDSVQADSNRGNFLTNVANTGSAWLANKLDSVASVHVPELRIIELVTPGSGLLTPDLLRSDHAPFWQANLPGLMLTDGADFRNPNYHTPGDTLGSVNQQFLYRNIKAIVGTLAALAKPKHATASESNDVTISLPVATIEPVPVTHLTISPNPGEHHFAISFQMEKTGPVTMEIYDIEGRLIRSLHKGPLQAGSHEFDWNADTQSGQHVSTGMYLLNVVTEAGALSRRIVVGDFHHHH